MNFDYSIQPRSVYIHWPFCPYKCHFCPFVALAGHDAFMERYHDSLCKEIERFGLSYPYILELDTLFLGGGTPSTYPLNLLLDMFGTLNKVFTFSSTAEITIEVNPGTVTANHIKIWRQLGINRLSIGVQSLNDATLKALNRQQSVHDVENTLALATPLFDTISIDLIIGLPNSTKEEWQSFMRRIVQWPIKHISLYFLTIHEHTPLYFAVHSKKVELVCDETMVDLYNWSAQFLHEQGFVRYELSNFSKPGFASRHNQVYWCHLPYKAFGLGACSFDGKVRFQNTKNLMSYIEKNKNNQEVTDFYEQLSEEQLYLETLMLGLRCNKGVSIQQLKARLSHEKHDKLDTIIMFLCNQKLLVQKDECIWLTPQGLVVENEIVLKLAVL